MSDYIELKTITPSSSEESVFNQPSTSTGVRHRGGYVAIPINSSNSSLSSAGSTSKSRLIPTPTVGAAVVGAGHQYQHIYESQLGAAASDPSNPLTRLISGNRDEYYAAVPWELRRLGLQDRQRLIKPYGVSWNKETKAKYPEHWRLVNPRRGLKKAKKQEQKKPQEQEESINQRKQEPSSNGLTLPFSNNIGPGNPIRPATNTADLIAQGHDLHYQEAKKDSDVLSADREAISQFAHEAIQGQDPVSRIHATVGGLGLGIKHAVERLSGKVVYGKQCLELNLWVRIPRIARIGQP